jgi:hypothetical protein
MRILGMKKCGARIGMGVSAPRKGSSQFAKTERKRFIIKQLSGHTRPELEYAAYISHKII